MLDEIDVAAFVELTNEFGVVAWGCIATTLNPETAVELSDALSSMYDEDDGVDDRVS